jgi:hypothetical protein
MLASFDTRSDYRLYAYELANSLPRAYFAHRVFEVPARQGALELLLRPDLSLRESVILEGWHTANEGDTGARGSARIMDYRNRTVLCQTVCSTAGYLVLLDNYYPGWRAYIDGREAEILRANYAFRAVAVPAGNHLIEFRYKPRSFYLGLSVTLLTVALGCAVLAWVVLAGRRK